MENTGLASPYGSAGSAYAPGSPAPDGRRPRGSGKNGVLIAVIAVMAVIIVVLAAIIGIMVKNDRDDGAGTNMDSGYTEGGGTGGGSENGPGSGYGVVLDGDSEDDSDNGNDSVAGGGTAMPSSPTLVSDPVTANPYAYTVGPESVYIQDIYDFMGAAMSVELPDEDSKRNDPVYYAFKGSSANVEDIEEYVDAICDGAHNLELIDKWEKTYDDTFVSYAIRYTGTGRVDYTQEANFSDIDCNICLYYTLERGKLKGMLILPASMEVVDLGLRLGGVSEDVQIGGPSANAGLYLMPDGSFQTDDGRLSVQVGQAVILRDGELYTTDAEFKRGKTEDHVWAWNFYRDETIFFSSPASRIMTGDIFTLRDLYYDKSWGFDNADDFDVYVHETPFLGLGHDGDFITPKSFANDLFDDATVRIMYWEPGVVGVYYVYAKLASAPYEIEALIAPSLDKSEGYTGGSAERQMVQGQTITLDCSRKYGPNYELYTWEIVSGSGVVELTNTTSPSCTVTAMRSGTAVVRVSYNYGMDEPDVLTGIERNADHTDVQEFTIYVQ